MGTIDRTRPYGTVCGVSDHTYEQDGKGFDGMGNEVGRLEPEISESDNVETPIGMTKGNEASDVQAEEEISGEPTSDELPYTNFGKLPTPEIEKPITPKPEKKRGRPPKK